MLGMIQPEVDSGSGRQNVAPARPSMSVMPDSALAMI